MTVSTQNTPSLSLKPLYVWAGGKSKLLKSYNPHLPDLNSVSAYVEPFFGAGALFASVKSTYIHIPAIINDVNPELIALLNTIKYDHDELITQLQELEAAYLGYRSLEVRNYHFYRIREQYWKAEIGTVRASALLFFCSKQALTAFGLFHAKLVAMAQPQDGLIIQPNFLITLF